MAKPHSMFIRRQINILASNPGADQHGEFVHRCLAETLASTETCLQQVLAFNTKRKAFNSVCQVKTICIEDQ